jgi:hypothetical protein
VCACLLDDLIFLEVGTQAGQDAKDSAICAQIPVKKGKDS